TRFFHVVEKRHLQEWAPVENENALNVERNAVVRVVQILHEFEQRRLRQQIDLTDGLLAHRQSPAKGIFP
ncbi:hypothetical protein HMPREF9996_01486, partial [Aggregatibacter actinomycetemcomitans Y4]